MSKKKRDPILKDFHRRHLAPAQPEVIYLAICKTCNFTGKPMTAADLQLMRMAVGLGSLFCPQCHETRWHYHIREVTESPPTNVGQGGV